MPVRIGTAMLMKPRAAMAVVIIIITAMLNNSARLKSQSRRTRPSSGCTRATSKKSRKKAAGVEEFSPSWVPLRTNSPYGRPTAIAPHNTAPTSMARTLIPARSADFLEAFIAHDPLNLARPAAPPSQPPPHPSRCGWLQGPHPSRRTSRPRRALPLEISSPASVRRLRAEAAILHQPPSSGTNHQLRTPASPPSSTKCSYCSARLMAMPPAQVHCAVPPPAKPTTARLTKRSYAAIGI